MSLGGFGKGRRHAGGGAARLRRLAIAAALAAVGALAAAQAASAGLQKEFSIFAHCPVEDPTVLQCVVSTTTSGEFKIASKTVPVNKPVILQGGITKAGILVPAVGADTLSHTALEVPGGLVGIELLPPLTTVTATAELAGTVELNPTNTNAGSGTAAVLPMKVKLDNPSLGPACYVGSDSEPMVPHLTTGTTSPPEGVEPISGNTGAPAIEGQGKIVTLKGASLVDNTFPVPGVNGCGGPLLELVVDPSTDLVIGLPSAAGQNVAVLTGDLAVASAHNVVAQRALPELGRCVKLTGEKIGKITHYTGNFLASNCLEESPPHNGPFEFLPGPGPKNHFTTKTGKVTLETVSGKKVKCLESHGSGEYTGAKSATQSVTLLGCTAPSGKCNSAGAGEGTVTATGLAETLGYILDNEVNKEVHISLGWDLAHGPSLVAAECGAAKESLVLTGSVIGTISSIQKSVAAYTVKFVQSKGIQSPESFEEAPKDTISASFAGGAGVQAGLATTQKVTNEEKLLFKAEQEE